MDKRRNLSDNNEVKITVKVETQMASSSNSNLSSAQFAPRSTEVDIITY